MLLRSVPGSERPVFYFSRLFSLLRMASSVAGQGPRAVLGLVATGFDALALLVRKPGVALDLTKGVLRWGKFRASWAARKCTAWAASVLRGGGGAAEGQ